MIPFIMFLCISS